MRPFRLTLTLALAAVLSPVPALAGFTGTDVLIPAVARIAGAGGAQFTSTVWVTNLSLSSAATIEAGRIAAQQYLRSEGRLYIRIFPQKPVTSIPLETRMGKGKGEPEYWAAVVKPGTVLYEIGGVSEEVARLCFTRLAHKMPVKVRFIRRRPM